MKTRDLIKDFNDDGRDLRDALERELDRILDLAATPAGSGKAGAKEDKDAKESATPKDLRELMLELDRRTDKMDKLFIVLHHEFEEVEHNRKATGTAKPPATPPPVNMHAFEDAFDKVGKSLEGHLRWIRSALIGRADLSDQFERAATAGFNSLKKLEVEVDKFGSAELKRALKKEKPLQVVPSKFLADYKALMKAERVDPVKEVEDRLKRLDSNHEFDSVTPLSEAAIDVLNKTTKKLDKKTRKELIADLEKLAKSIEDYDNKMFLFSKMK